MEQATTDGWIVDVGIPIAGKDWQTAFNFGVRLERDVRKWNGEVGSAGMGFGTRDIQFIFDSVEEAKLAYDWINSEMKQMGYDPDLQGATDENLGEMTCYISMYKLDVEGIVEEIES